jgi:curved DNA-binding protein CbpA
MTHQPADPEFDAYKTLQVDPEADQEVIQAAFRRLAQKWHPDVAGGAEAAARMTAINRAWEVLRDPGRRAMYDQARGNRAKAASPANATTGTSPGAASAPAASAEGPAGSSLRPDPGLRRPPGAAASATPPPGQPSGSVLNFGRYDGWSLGEIARTDLEYIEWLDRTPIGRPYRQEIDEILRRTGRRKSAEAEAKERRGLFRPR